MDIVDFNRPLYRMRRVLNTFEGLWEREPEEPPWDKTELNVLTRRSQSLIKRLERDIAILKSEIDKISS